MGGGAISDTSAKLAFQILEDGELRAWSVIVTIMGDLTADPANENTDGRISGTDLNTLMAALGFTPEATRVALHRLRRDDWIVSHRSGRGSEHHLSKRGLSETRSVAGMIYAADRPPVKTMVLAIARVRDFTPELANIMAKAGFIELARSVFLGDTQPPHPELFLTFKDHQPNVPDWVAETALSSSLRNDSDQLSRGLRKLAIPASDQEPFILRATLRIIILHQWRRIALRLKTPVAEQLLASSHLRKDVHDALKRLGPLDFPKDPG